MIGTFASNSFLTPTTVSEKAPQAESTASDLAQFPEDISDHLTGFLQLDEINSLALSSRNQRAILQVIFADKLEPKHLGQGDPVQ